MAFSNDCSSDHCKQRSKKADNGLNNPSIKKLLSNNENRTYSDIKSLKKQIITSVSNQVSKIDTDLSLSYRKKTISIHYNMDDKIPAVDSYFSLSYGDSTVKLNYTIAIW